MKTIIIIILLLSFSLKGQTSMVLGIPMTHEQDLTFDYYSSCFATIGLSQFFDKVTNHKRPILCGVASMILNSGAMLLERGQDGKVVRGSAIAGGFLIHVVISHIKDDKIYEAEQMCNDLKNPIFLRDSI